MHREHSLKREQIVQHGEDRLLDFTGIGRVPDNAELLRKVQNDKRVRSRSINLRDTLEGGHGDHREIGNVSPVRFIRLGQKKHVPGEHGMPGVFADDADRHSVVRIGSGIAILDEHVSPLEKALEAIVEVVELIRAEGTVVLSPPNLLFRRGFLHDELISG